MYSRPEADVAQSLDRPDGAGSVTAREVPMQPRKLLCQNVRSRTPSQRLLCRPLVGLLTLDHRYYAGCSGTTFLALARLLQQLGAISGHRNAGRNHAPNATRRDVNIWHQVALNTLASL